MFYTIFHVLLAYTSFLLSYRLSYRLFFRLLPRVPIPLELFSFLVGTLVFLFVFRHFSRSTPTAPSNLVYSDKSTCSLPMAFVHICYGFFWLILLMLGVLALFPVSGDTMVEPLPMRILSAALVHPICEELIFRRLCLTRLLSLSVTEENEIVSDTKPMTHTPTRAGMLFALLAQALLFALVHTGSGGMLYGFAGGVVLGVLAMRTGRLWVSMACHMLINLRSVVYPLLSPALVYRLDAVSICIGLLCGSVFWIQRCRAELRKRQGGR